MQVMCSANTFKVLGQTKDYRVSKQSISHTKGSRAQKETVPVYVQ